MKFSLIAATVFACLFLLPFSHGQSLMIVDAASAELLPITHDSLFVEVQDQVASVRTRTTFSNPASSTTEAKFAFPLNPGAAVTSLRWMNNADGVWHEASFEAEPQDDDLPGGGSGGSATDANLAFYLSDSPLYFEFNEGVSPGGTRTVELEYVMLLPYELGILEFGYPQGYTAISGDEIQQFYCAFHLDSQRTIMDMESGVGTPTWSQYSGDWVVSETAWAAGSNFGLTYEVNNDELALFGYSTFLTPESHPDCDTLPAGFFGFVAEPPVSEDVEVIDKVFTLIIDTSGSMSGNKMTQAKDAASFIVDHLNPGDAFNIVEFNGSVSSWASSHMDYTPTNANNAQTFIDGLSAGGSTNISGAFSNAIPPFASADPEKAHIIIFFTDGAASAGITNTPQLINHVNDLRETHDPNLILFTFGIGDGANENLLAALALNANGLYAFADGADLYQSISDFYLLIQNPVLLNTEVSFNPPVTFHVFPDPLQNLYIGQQLQVFGRYEVPQPVEVTLSGDAFGQAVSYTYYLDLADGEIDPNAFVTTMWANQNIGSLQNQYYLTTDLGEQEELQQEIVDLSLCFGVVSDFTSFGDNTDVDTGGGGSTNIDNLIENARETPQLAYPNPFVDQLAVDLSLFAGQYVRIRLVDSMGRVVLDREVLIGGDGQLMLDGPELAAIKAGTYLLQVQADTRSHAEVLVKQ